jgi:hypothetical protein
MCGFAALWSVVKVVVERKDVIEEEGKTRLQ